MAVTTKEETAATMPMAVAAVAAMAVEVATELAAIVAPGRVHRGGKGAVRW